MNAKIYIINLEKSPQRFARITQSLAGTTFPIERVAGVYGKNLSNDEIAGVTKKMLFPRALLRNEIGCYLSHLAALKKMLSDGVEFGIIFEDDAVVGENFDAAVKAALTARRAGKCDWDLLKLSDSNKVFLKKSSAGAFACVQCYPVPAMGLAQIWTPAAAEKFLRRRQKFGRPYDIDLKYVWENKIKTHNLYPDIVTHLPVPSTIGDRDNLKKNFFKNLLYRAHFILRRFLWSVGENGFRQTLKMEWRA